MTWAALRYRPAQALLLAVLTALVVGCAAFAPLYERALAQSLLRDGLSRMPPAATAIELTTSREQGARVRAERVRDIFPTSLAGVYGPGVERWSGRVFVTGSQGVSTVTMWGSPTPCDGLVLDAGRCPQAPFEVLASTAEARLQGWAPGAVISAVEARGIASGPAFASPVTVVGTYTQEELAAGPWAGLRLGGRAGTMSAGLAAAPLMDALVTSDGTFAPDEQASSFVPGAPGWFQVAVSVTYPLNRDAISLESLDGIPGALSALGDEAARELPRIAVSSAVGDLADELAEGRRQVLVIVPLLMAQLALLGVVVLGLVAESAVEQRRPEAALSRLRGGGASGARRLLVAELGAAASVGAPLGLLGALGVTTLVRASWLAPGVPAELPWPTFAAAGLGLLLAWAAIIIAVGRVVREPVADLLRRVPSRQRGRRMGLVDAGVVGVSVAGVVALASGNLAGPLALATPALVALAVGIVLAHLLTPAATLIGRRSLDRGRLTATLTAVQIARRPAVRRIVTIITVAAALATFAVNALVVGQHNRELRARVETGAAVVLTTDSDDPAEVQTALRQVDPAATKATPVAWIRQGSSDSITTMAVIPEEFARVADLAVDPAAFDLRPLQVAGTLPPVITGTRLSVTIGSSAIEELDEVGDAPQRAGEGPIFAVRLGKPGGAEQTLSLDPIPLTSSVPVVFTAEVDCPQGCSLLAIGVDRVGLDYRVLRGRFTITELRGDAGPPAAIGRPDTWIGSGDKNADVLAPYAVPGDLGSPTAVALDLLSARTGVRVTAKGAVGNLPAFVVGSLPPGTTSGGTFQGAGLDGIAVQFQPVGTLPYTPGGPSNVAIVSLRALLDRASTLAPVVGRLQVYLADSSFEAPVRDALGAQGISVTTTVRESDRQALYDGSASAWGLRLAVVVGLLAIVMAALVLVLVVTTAWRPRSRDYAALRMSGVPLAVLRRASALEQGTVVVVAGVAGILCGLLASRLALPMVPLFTRPSATFLADLRPAWSAVGGAAALVLGLLGVVAIVVGTRLVSRAIPARLRERL